MESLGCVNKRDKALRRVIKGVSFVSKTRDLTLENWEEMQGNQRESLLVSQGVKETLKLRGKFKMFLPLLGQYQLIKFQN